MIKKLILFIVFFLGLQAQAINLDEFKKIIIVDQGRKKPLDSFARLHLLRLSGKTSYQKLSASQWLAHNLFEPRKAMDDKVFLVNNPEVIEALKLSPNKTKRYSYNELSKGLERLYSLALETQNIPEKERTLIQKQTLILFDNINSFLQINNSLLFSVVHPDFTVSQDLINELHLKSHDNNLFSILKRSKQLADLLSKKPSEESIKLSFKLYSWIEYFKELNKTPVGSNDLAVIPIDKTTWLSPWQIIYERNDKKFLLDYLVDGASAYKSSNQEGFDTAIKSFNSLVQKDLGFSEWDNLRINCEILYNNFAPLNFALAFYFLALISIFTLKGITNATNLIAFAFHSTAIILRIIILTRPPVTNIFETFVFVSWVIVILSLLMQLDKKSRDIALLLSSICGFLLLLVANKFASEGETMQALMAVLDSNFWLSTHVICITAGYAGVYSAGILGHFYLIQRLLKDPLKNTKSQSLKNFIFQGILKQENLLVTKNYLLATLGFGLCVSLLGTLLGGIWADQSWGRFWGWDPKENGALLIVLWCAVLFHARLAGMIRDFGLAIGSVIGCIVVVVSWLGVNLLGVGLHSYGFTDSLFYGFISYIAVEFLFILFIVAKK